MLQAIIKPLAIGGVIGAVLFTFVDYAFSIPDVKMSYASNTCVEVINYPSTLFGTTNFSCADMPVKFNHIWVE